MLLAVEGTQMYALVKAHQTVPLTWLHFTVYELYLNKFDLGKHNAKCNKFDIIQRRTSAQCKVQRKIKDREEYLQCLKLTKY